MEAKESVRWQSPLTWDMSLEAATLAHLKAPQENGDPIEKMVMLLLTVEYFLFFSFSNFIFC